LRPVLVLASHDLFANRATDPMPAAAALEMIHTYSLIHDDLPAMDNDDFRRGRPTCHKQFGEAMAILAGDALLTEALRLLAHAYAATGPAKSAVIAEIAAAAGAAGMVGGQVEDIRASAPGHGPIEQNALEALHAKKTGALLRAAVRAGAILGGANDAELAALTEYGECIGLAFQVADDVLDVTATSAALGKTKGKDEAQGKTTFVTLLGVEASLAYAQRLVQRAHASLARFDARGQALRTLADFIVVRES
jgi:geranylgeranyl diphosphate synthase type II